MLGNGHLNPLLASFFTKVLGLLLVRKADYVSLFLSTVLWDMAIKMFVQL